VALGGQVPSHVHQWDPNVDGPDPYGQEKFFGFMPSVFVIATDHDEFFATSFPAGSVVIDPWGRTRDQPDVRVVRVGRR